MSFLSGVRLEEHGSNFLQHQSLYQLHRVEAPEKLPDPFFGDMLRAWRAQRSEQACPERSAFLPEKHRNFLRYLTVIRIGDLCKEELRLSLTGEHPAQYLSQGYNISIDQMRATPQGEAYFQQLSVTCARLRRTHKPDYAIKSCDSAQGEPLYYQNLMLPYMKDGVVSSVIMMQKFYHEPNLPSQLRRLAGLPPKLALAAEPV